MLSILLTVAFFRGTTAVACEGDQVEKLISIYGENTCVCYYESIFLTTSIMSSWHAWHDYIQCNVSKNSQSKSGTQLRILSSPHDFIVSKTPLSPFASVMSFQIRSWRRALAAPSPPPTSPRTTSTTRTAPSPSSQSLETTSRLRSTSLSFTRTMLYIFNVRSFYQNVQKIKIYP